MTSYTLNRLKNEIAQVTAQRDELLMFAEQALAIFNDYEIYHTNKGDETKAARNRVGEERLWVPLQ